MNSLLKIQTLSSGSKGNVILVASETTKIVIDVGLPLPQLVKRFHKAEIDPKEIDAVLVTHEHYDHVVGLPAFIDKFGALVYLHSDVAELFPSVPSERVKLFSKEFTIGDIKVDYFPVPHDSRFCFGYTFSKGDMKISLATDLGRVTEDIIRSMSGSQIVMLECNHDLLKLSHNKKYPYFLKRRITSSHGHLSNPSCALAVYQLARLGVSQIILAHLSEENNSPTIAYSFVKDFLETRGIIEGRDIWIDVAAQNEPSAAFICEKLAKQQ